MGDKAKPALSSKILQLKFMQRANEKKLLYQAEEAAEKAEEGQDPSATGGPSIKAEPSPSESSKGCRIIYESMPCPAALGRFSFNSCNPDVENMKAGKSAGKSAAAPATAADPAEREDPDVTDTDMAKAFMRGPAADADGKRKKARTK